MAWHGLKSSWGCLRAHIVLFQHLMKTLFSDCGTESENVKRMGLAILIASGFRLQNVMFEASTKGVKNFGTTMFQARNTIWHPELLSLMYIICVLISIVRISVSLKSDVVHGLTRASAVLEAHWEHRGGCIRRTCNAYIEWGLVLGVSIISSFNSIHSS